MLATALAVLASLAPAATFPAADRSTAPVNIVYPGEREVVGPIENEFVLGSVIDQNAKLEINGQPVSIYKTGAFLAWVPVSPGTFTFHCSLTLPGGATFYFERSIFNTLAPGPLPLKPLTVDQDSPWPKQDVELRAGDWIFAKVRATAGQKAQWKLGKLGWQPMREANPALGIYEGVYVVGPDDNRDAAPIEYKIGSGRGSVSVKSPGKVALTAGAPPIAALKGGLPFVMLKTAPTEGELFPALAGARFVTGGRAGENTKILLSGGLTGWVETKNLEFLPAGAKPPRAVTDVVSVKSNETETFVRIGLTERVPFAIEEGADLKSLTVRLYYTTAHTRWIVYQSSDPLVDEISFRQEAEGVVAVAIKLKQPLWGYNPGYESGSLRVELRRPPVIAEKGSPLKDRVIFLDPGHMPSLPGTIGGLGTREMDVNYAIAQRVKELLAKEGAKPLVSRASPEEEVGLADRPKMAWDKKADIFLSIHNNNLASGANPFKGSPHGYSVFYYHPHSLALARAIYQNYEKLVPLAGEELRFGDLLVARLTGMPAVLTESAYLTYPEQEALLLDVKFRDSLAQAMVAGLRGFLADQRLRQKGRDKPRKREGDQ